MSDFIIRTEFSARKPGNSGHAPHSEMIHFATTLEGRHWGYCLDEEAAIKTLFKFITRNLFGELEPGCAKEGRFWLTGKECKLRVWLEA